MEALDKKRIETGRRWLLISLGVLAISSLLYAYFFYLGAEGSPLFSKFTTLNWFIPPMVILMGAGVFQGSKPVKWILCGLLVMSIAFECYLFATFGLPDGASRAFFILTTLLGGLDIYMIMVDVRVEEFLLFQRSKNYGEYVTVSEQEATEAPKPKAKKGAALLEEDEEIVESTTSSTGGKKRKKRNADWEDELGIYEED